jgi:hypothetical protein
VPANLALAERWNPHWAQSLSVYRADDRFKSQQSIVDLEQVLAPRLKRYLDSALTPSPVAAVEAGHAALCGVAAQQAVEELAALKALRLGLSQTYGGPVPEPLL